MSNENNNNKITISIKVPEDVEKGVYANAMQVGHSRDEFVLDFINFIPHQNSGTVNARVVLTPSALKRIIAALQDNLSKYEKNYGTVEYSDQSSIGFTPDK